MMRERRAMVSSHQQTNGLAYMIARDLQKYGFKVKPLDVCLCRSEFRDNDGQFPDIVFSHPSDTLGITIGAKNGFPNCWEEHRRLIQAHPGIEFYLIATGEYNERRQGIGEFPNLKYLTMGNIRDALEELKESIKPAA